MTKDLNKIRGRISYLEAAKLRLVEELASRKYLDGEGAYSDMKNYPTWELERDLRWTDAELENAYTNLFYAKNTCQACRWDWEGVQWHYASYGTLHETCVGHGTRFIPGKERQPGANISKVHPRIN